MGSPLLHLGAQIICPHGGQVAGTPGSARVMVAGNPVATVADTTVITGCALTVPATRPRPCRSLQWNGPATRVLVGGHAALLQSSSGICLSADKHPQGSPTVVTAQTRAMGI
jgi:hypothetical protein